MPKFTKSDAFEKLQEISRQLDQTRIVYDDHNDGINSIWFMLSDAQDLIDASIAKLRRQRHAAA